MRFAATFPLAPRRFLGYNLLWGQFGFNDFKFADEIKVNIDFLSSFL